MRKRPGLLIACVAVMGILMGYRHSVWPILISIGILLYAISRWLWKSKWAMAIGTSVVLVAVFGGFCWNTTYRINFRERELLQLTEQENLRLCGEIYKKEWKNNQLTVYLKNCKAQTNEVIACNRVIVYLDADTYSIGEILLLNGKFHRFKKATNSGEFDLEAYYATQGIDFYLDNVAVEKSEKARFGVRELLYDFRIRIAHVYEASLTSQRAGVLSSILLGEKGSLDADTKQLYKNAGISHVLAISGLHVSLIGMGIYQFLRKRRTNFLASFLIATSFLVLYAMMTGESVSTMRATFMLVIAMWGKVLGRSSDSLNSLGLVVTVLLLANPLLLYSTGFLFSFGTVAGILMVGDSFREKTGSVVPWFVTLPLVAYFYYEVPSYSFLVNMLVLPLVQFLFLLGLLGGILGSVYLPLGKVLLLPCQWILGFYELVAKLSKQLPWATIITGRPSAWQMVLYYVVLFAGAGILRYLSGRKTQKRWPPILLSGAIACCLLAIIFLPHTNVQSITALDVGQGDAIYIEAGRNQHIFVDGGSSSKSKLGEYILLPFLKYKGVKRIDYWVVSHFDEDHISGLKEVLESDYRVRYLILAKVWEDKENATVEEMLALAKKHNTQILWVEAGDELQMKEGRLLFLYPDKEVTSEDSNALSLSFLLEVDGFRGVFAGDATAETEKAILAQYKDVLREVDYYKVNHHGSKYSSSSEWLAVIRPHYAVISCGRNNWYGHPHEETIERLTEQGGRIYRTDEMGEVKVLIE